MRVTENALNVLAAKTYKGVGRAWIVKHLEGIESPVRLVDLLNQSVMKGRSIPIGEFEERREVLRKQCERFAGVVDGVVAIGDSNFPSCRGVVKNSERSVALFYRGNLSLLEKQNRNVAVIGLLDPDKDTTTIEEHFVSHLVSNGVTIVSGLALGCDSVAHKQALLSGGNTIAALPSPVTDVLPSTNRQLAEEIAENGGLLMSEYYEDARSKMELSGRYLERDRLQALFSDCVVLSASYSKNDSGNDSGSRHAMKYALCYSIPRAVMYDSELNAGNPKYDLNRQLIKEDSGIMVIRGDNVEEAIQAILSAHAGSPREEWGQKSLFE